jgi:hypothetical protein
MYAMTQGVTVHMPTRDAMSQRVAVWFFFWRFVGDGASAASRSSSPTDEGDVKMNLNAYGRYLRLNACNGDSD